MWTNMKLIILNCIINSCNWNSYVAWRGNEYELSEDDTIVSKHVGSVIIYKLIVIVLLLVILQNVTVKFLGSSSPQCELMCECVSVWACECVSVCVMIRRKFTWFYRASGAWRRGIGSVVPYILTENCAFIFCDSLTLEVRLCELSKLPEPVTQRDCIKTHNSRILWNFALKARRFQRYCFSFQSVMKPKFADQCWHLVHIWRNTLQDTTIT